MTARQWILGISAAAEAERDSAVAHLVALGPEALPVLMDELRDDASLVTEAAPLSVLRRIVEYVRALAGGDVPDHLVAIATKELVRTIDSALMAETVRRA